MDPWARASGWPWPASPMLYLAIGAGLLWLGMTVYRRTPGLQRGRWRVGAGVGAAMALGAGCLLAARGQWIIGGVLAAVALVMALGARRERHARPRASPAGGPMSEAEARSLLGVGPEAGADEIRAAYGRLMRMAHPDRGGTAGLASQLNAARDRLLKGR